MKNTRIKLKQPERDQAEQALKDYMAQGGKIQQVPQGRCADPDYMTRREVNEAQWRRRLLNEPIN